MCTGNSTAGSSHGYTSMAIVSVATAATSWRRIHRIVPVVRPGWSPKV